MYRARLIAMAIIRCSLAEAPERLREYILPLGVINRRSSSARL